MSTASNLEAVASLVPPGVKLVAVSKFHPAGALLEAYGAGQRVFGESRALELVDKARSLPADIEWHFIGHLQTNKVRLILPYVSLIHSIDSERLLRLVNDEAVRLVRTVDVLVQLHVAREETKYGFSPQEALGLFTPALAAQLPGVRLRGVMGMASNTDDDVRIGSDFGLIASTFHTLREALGCPGAFDTLSMGMSHDWPQAVACGSNLIRVGTAIFGEREY